MNTEITFENKLMLRDDNGVFFGPGSAELLEAIDKTGSVRSAASTMGLSYTKAWTIIRNAQKGIGEELVLSVKGGAGGGNARLTDEGKKLLKGYKSFSKKAQTALEKAFIRSFK